MFDVEAFGESTKNPFLGEKALTAPQNVRLGAMTSGMKPGDVAICCSGSYPGNAASVDKAFREVKSADNKQLKVALGYIWMNKVPQNAKVESRDVPKTPTPTKSKETLEDSVGENATPAKTAKRGMRGAQDVQQYHMAAEKSTKCMRSKPRLTTGSSHSMVIPDVVKMDHKCKCVPSITPEDKRVILADVQASVDCSAVERYTGGKESRGLAAKRKKAAGYNPLIWSPRDWKCWQEILHQINASNVIDYAGYFF